MPAFVSREDHLYYLPTPSGDLATLSEEESHHLIAVMRGRVGDRIRLTDGKGVFYDAEVVETAKRSAVVRLLASHSAAPPLSRLHIGIAPTKQIDRFEWFLEKATELGVHAITPLLCSRSERTALRIERLEKRLIAALKQSQQAWLPRLLPLTPVAEVIRRAEEPVCAIAWCGDTPRTALAQLWRPRTDTIVLIGPEGDFTTEEVALAQAQGFTPIHLGQARLRTETAGLLVAAAHRLYVQQG